MPIKSNADEAESEDQVTPLKLGDLTPYQKSALDQRDANLRKYCLDLAINQIGASAKGTEVFDRAEQFYSYIKTGKANVRESN